MDSLGHITLKLPVEELGWNVKVESSSDGTDPASEPSQQHMLAILKCQTDSIAGHLFKSWYPTSLIV